MRDRNEDLLSFEEMYPKDDSNTLPDMEPDILPWSEYDHFDEYDAFGAEGNSA